MWTAIINTVDTFYFIKIAEWYQNNLNYLFPLFPAGTMIETDSFQQNTLFLTNPQFLEHILFSQDVFGIFHSVSLIWSELWLKGIGAKSIVLSFSYSETARMCAGSSNTSVTSCSRNGDPWGISPWLIPADIIGFPIGKFWLNQLTVWLLEPASAW